jgi:PAS domain S-box-containing protein
MLIWWGSELVMLYNDAYRPILGSTKHPKAIGQCGRECWQESWDIIGPMLEAVMATGQSTLCDDQLLLLDRNGYIEECYFTFSYSPIRDETGNVGGVFTAVTETTGRVLGERRLQTLRDLAARAVVAKTAQEACELTADILAENPHDIGFALSYLLDHDKQQGQLVGTTRLNPETPLSPRQIDFVSQDAPAGIEALLRVASTGQAELIEDLRTQFDLRLEQDFSNFPNSALVLPIAKVKQERPIGLLVVGISPRRALDDDYRSFFELVAGQIASAITNARAYEQECKRPEALADHASLVRLLLVDDNADNRDYVKCLLQQQNARAEAEAAYQQVTQMLERITDAFVAVDNQWRYTYVNTRAEELLGQTQEQLLGRSMWDVFPDAVQTKGYTQAQQAMREQNPRHFEEYYPFIDRWFEVFIYPSPEGLSLYFRDISERKQTEVALQQANERFKMAAIAIKGVIYDWDIETDRVERTPGLIDVVGYRPEEVEPTRQWWSERIHPEDRQRLSKTPEEFFGNRSSFTVEYRVRHRDGQYRYVWDRGLIERNAVGQVVRIVGCNLDVSERIWAQEALKESEERFRTMADTAPVLIWMAGPDKLCDYLNQTWLCFTGRPLEQELGNGWTQGIHPNDLERSLDTYITAFDARQKFTMEYRLRRFDGEYRWILDTGIPRFTSDGTFIGYIGSCIDITERKQSEEAQQYLSGASQVLFSSLDYQTTLSSVAQLTVPQLADWCTVHVIEEDGSIQQVATAHVNPAKVAWGRKLSEKYPFDPNAERGIPQVLRTGQSELYPDIPDHLLVEAARDAEHLQILREVGFNSVMIVPLLVQGRTLGAISFVAAESGRRYNQVDLALAEELAHRAAIAVDNARLYRVAQRERAQAEAANRIKDEFLAVLSHELRSPLNPILGWTKLLRSRPFDQASAARALETIERNAQIQTQLIEDLLDVSGILQGKTTLDVSPVNLVSTIEAAIETVRLAAEAKSIQITTQLDPSVGYVSGDSSRLQQVIWNIVSNAVKFTSPQGQVEVRLSVVCDRASDDGKELGHAASVSSQSQRTTDYYAQIQVSDTGKGINPDFLPYVFDYFRQENSSTTRKFGGLGLGLAIARYLVELHGGTVDAQSPGEGQGATFTVTLPLQRVGTPKSEDNRLRDNAPELEGVRILLVDDEQDTRELLQIILEEYGAQVRAVASPREALAAVQQWQPDLLLSDIGMPEVDGYTLIRQIRAMPPEDGGLLPAIALTAYAGETDHQQALLAGFERHVTKPIEPSELATVIAMHLERNRNRYT